MNVDDKNDEIWVKLIRCALILLNCRKYQNLRLIPSKQFSSSLLTFGLSLILKDETCLFTEYSSFGASNPERLSSRIYVIGNRYAGKASVPTKTINYDASISGITQMVIRKIMQNAQTIEGREGRPDLWDLFDDEAYRGLMCIYIRKA